PWSVDTAGRWARLPAHSETGAGATGDGETDEVQVAARALLRRYGVVFRRLLARETAAPPWRELVRAYRRMELRGTVRGGRFVEGMTGEQFALPEAVGTLRAVRRANRPGDVVAISAADPLNLVGIVTPGQRVPAVATNWIALRDGLPVAALEADRVRALAEGAEDPAIQAALGPAGIPPTLRPYLHRRKPRRPRTEAAERAAAPPDA
ncbi:MAG: Lhr family helicase, partial [Longimicrobiales bacterium]